MASAGDDFKTSKPFGSVKMPYVVLGGRPIRYMIVSKSDKTFSVKEPLNSTFGIPLFMASDVLAGISHLAKNNCRIHNRFGKEGLATKLLFPDCRLSGVANCGSVWFYSIQGVFKAVFEYHETDIQRDCLIILRDVWLKNFQEECVPETMSLTPEEGTAITEDTHSYKDLKQDISCAQAKIVNRSHQTEDQEHIAVITVEKFLNSANDLCRSHPLEPEVLLIVQVLELLKMELQYYRASPSNCFPFEILDSYMSHLKDFKLNQDLRKSEFNIPPRKNIALCVISKWLGTEFRSFEQMISKHVETFKKDHIDCIDNLPPAESIVNSLFPVAMQCLLGKWLGLNEDYLNETINTDHNYSPPEKCARLNRDSGHNLYPLMQIILEFANNALVSGTAHVVFSRLRYAE